MQIQLSSRALAAALSVCAKAIDAKNAIAILADVMLSEKDGKYFLTGSSTTQRTTVPVDLSLISGQFEPVMLPLARLSAIVNALPDVVLTLNLDVTDRNADGTPRGVSILAQYAGGKFSLMTNGASEFPDMPFKREAQSADEEFTLNRFAIPAPRFIKCVKDAQQYCGTNEAQLVMTGVAMDVSDCGVTFVASDGHKLYKYAYQQQMDKEAYGAEMFSNITPDQKCLIILPHQAVGAVSAFMQGRQGLMHIEYNGSGLFFTAQDGATYQTRAIEGRYPNYNSVIPQDVQNYVTVNRKELLEKIKRTSLFANASTQLCKLTLGGSLIMSVTAEDIDFAMSGSEDITVIDQTGFSQLRIGVKATCATTILSSLESETVRLYVTDPTRPMLIRSEDVNEPFTGLLMPMLLQD